jgi:hypothetical protein
MEIDEKLLKKINRSLRTIKVMLGLFLLTILALLATLGFIAYKVATFTHDVNEKVTNIQNSTTQQLDIKAQLCADNTSTIAKQLCGE